MGEGKTARERRRQSNTIRATVPISEELSEEIELEVEVRIEELSRVGIELGIPSAARSVTRASVMRDAIQAGLEAFRRRRHGTAD